MLTQPEHRGDDLLRRLGLAGTCYVKDYRLVVKITGHCDHCEANHHLHDDIMVWVFEAVREIAETIAPIQVELHVFGQPKPWIFGHEPFTYAATVRE